MLPFLTTPTINPTIRAVTVRVEPLLFMFQTDKDEHSAQISHRLSPKVGEGGFPASGEDPARNGNWTKNCSMWTHPQ
jgi:hypothetical protein